MSDKKPGLLSRLKQTISSTLNDAVDSVSDPGQEVALMLDDLAAQIQESERDLKQAIVDRKMLERKIEGLVQSEAEWQKRAEQALRLGDESLARAALKKKGEISAQLAEHKAALAEQTALADSMQQGITVAKNKLKALNLRRGSLMAQARAAKKGVMPGGLSDGGTFSRMEEIEARIGALESLNEAQAELSTDVAEAEIDAKLAALDSRSDGVDDALAALKKKIAGEQGSLPAGGSGNTGEGG
jgi:phage shock protein A